jgi:hypothetical protein
MIWERRYIKFFRVDSIVAMHACTLHHLWVNGWGQVTILKWCL